MLYKYFPLNLTHVTALPCETQVFSLLLHNVEMYYLQQSIWGLNQLALSSKLNMVYLAQLLVVMIDGLKIVRIRDGNVLRIHGHKRL